jgi:hypothetical protein
MFVRSSCVKRGAEPCKEIVMKTRTPVTLCLLFLSAAVVPPSIWAPQELCYWLDGYRPQDAAESDQTVGAGYCYGQYCSQNPAGCPTTAGPPVFANCAGRPWAWLCTSGLFRCDFCTAAVGTPYKPCRASAFPESRCNENAGVPTPCASLVSVGCVWVAPAGPCVCAPLPVPLPAGLPACTISDCQ